jgi:hypothetical protein
MLVLKRFAGNFTSYKPRKNLFCIIPLSSVDRWKTREEGKGLAHISFYTKNNFQPKFYEQDVYNPQIQGFYEDELSRFGQIKEQTIQFLYIREYKALEQVLERKLKK